MFNLFRAEWMKLTGNRWATSFFVWIFPAIPVALMGFGIFAALLSADARESLGSDQEQMAWYSNFVFSWEIVNNEFGRWMIAAFTAVVFAGEYQFGTWKAIVPGRQRMTVIFNKFFTILVFVLVAWIGMSLLYGIGGFILSAILGNGYGEVNSVIVRDFINGYGVNMFVAVTSVSVAIGYAALAATITHNILSSVFIAISITFAEKGILIPLYLLNEFFHVEVYDLYLYTPGYNLSNISKWGLDGKAYIEPIFREMSSSEPHSLGASLLIVFVWIFGLIGLTVWRFNRQDIVS